MITLRRDQDRHHRRSNGQETWHTFQALEGQPAFVAGFDTLELLGEIRLRPGASAPHQKHSDAEMLSYVREGTLAYHDSSGRSGVIHAGEFEIVTAGPGIRRSEDNASRANWVHVFQIGLCASTRGQEPRKEQKRFSVAERRNELCVVASPDARKKSLFIQQDSLVYSALLDVGQHVVHEILPGRIAWLHLVQGKVTLGDTVLTTGDGVGLVDEKVISLTAQEESEILLLDIAERRS